MSVLCFALSGAGLGIAGAAYAEVIGYVDPNVFSISLAARILIVGFVFSNRSLSAIAIAAIFVSVLPEIIRLVISGVWAAELEQIIYV